MLVKAKEFCEKVESELQKIKISNDSFIDLGDNALSDHLPLEYNHFGMFKVFTMNLLNPIYLKHLQDEDIGSQRLNFTKLARNDFTEERTRLQKELIVEKLQEKFILCLQEVSIEMTKWITSLEDTYNFQTNINSDNGKNRNITLFSKKTNIKVKKSAYFPTNNTAFVTSGYLDLELNSVNFTVVNVHVPFQQNKFFKEALNNIDPQKTVVICGDLNISSRLPKIGLSDHLLDYYNDECYNFPSPEKPFFTAINKFQNTIDENLQGSCNRMYDFMDHIIIRTPLEK